MILDIAGRCVIDLVETEEAPKLSFGLLVECTDGGEISGVGGAAFDRGVDSGLDALLFLGLAKLDLVPAVLFDWPLDLFLLT